MKRISTWKQDVLELLESPSRGRSYEDDVRSGYYAGRAAAAQGRKPKKSEVKALFEKSARKKHGVLWVDGFEAGLRSSRRKKR